MSSRLSGALAALPALLLLWYLPSLGELYRWRDQTRYGVSGSPRGEPREVLKFLTSPDWTWHAVLALAACAVVLGAALAVAARLPVFGFVTGAPLTAAGVYGMLSADGPRGLVGTLGFLSLPGPDVTAAQLRAGTMTYVGQGLCLLVGGSLLAAALCALLPSRRPPAGALPGALAGLVALVLAWGCVIEGGTRYTASRPGLTALAALLLGCVAGARLLPAAAPLACGLPVFALGLGEVLGWNPLLKIANVVLPLSVDSGEHILMLRGALFAAAVPMLVLGGALLVTALRREQGWRSAPRPKRSTLPRQAARPRPAARPKRTNRPRRVAR
ncbi:hypothetical protein [Actinocorallia aurantiaca]|uniref:Integral membrane protein n=1 Tax=Actinocorallia aurantiaca TaxID=46204 RepID=A0ABN3UE35_9ACTN